MGEQTNDRRAFFAWAGASLLVTFGLFGVGLLGVPLAVAGLVLAGVLQRRGPGWPAHLGLIAGVGGLCLLIAIAGDGSGTEWLLLGVVLIGSSTSAYEAMTSGRIRRV